MEGDAICQKIVTLKESLLWRKLRKKQERILASYRCHEGWPEAFVSVEILLDFQKRMPNLRPSRSPFRSNLFFFPCLINPAHPPAAHVLTLLLQT